MNSYFSIAVIGAFLPAVVLVYALAPRRVRPVVLLAASYLFFWSISGALLVFLLVSTVSVWALGLLLGRLQTRRRGALAVPGCDRKACRRFYRRAMRGVVAGGVILNIGILIALKYLGFFARIAQPLLALIGIAADGPGALGTIGVPIGISFYTLSAVSYLVDVYREGTAPDRNLGRLALFLAFFPQIMEGPICRYRQSASALWEGRPVAAHNLYRGGMRILWGLAKKLIVADRVNLFVKTVFDAGATYDGGVIALAAVLYTVQLYCDFSGTMDFAVGAGQMFGVELPENFRQPFFSRTAAEFWQRWHITLGSWFRDYVFYPVSLSAPVKRLTGAARRVLGNRMGPLAASGVALAAVWLCNGLWHGAGGQYVLFGLYYFVLIWGGGLMGPVAERFCAAVGIDHNGRAWHAWQRARTLAVVFVGELIFRAPGGTAALAMVARLVGGFTLASFRDGTVLSLGMDAADFAAVGAFCVALFVVGLLRECGTRLFGRMWAAHPVARVTAMVCLALTVVVFGAYGAGYQPVDPMYAQF